MSGLKIYVIDTETSGLNSAYHEMTEIGIIRAFDRVQIHRNIKCDYPERANMDALRITNKNIEDLSHGFEKKVVVEECNKFFEEDGLTPAHRVIVAHNTPFDRKFLHALWASQNMEFPAHNWLDTISLIKEYAKNIGINKADKQKFNLHAACDLVGIKKFSGAHNAKVDSRNCFLLHKNLVEDKKVNYLPFIKTFPHILSNNNYDDIDMSILED